MKRKENFDKDENIVAGDKKEFKLSGRDTAYTGGYESKKEADKKLKNDIEKLSDLQEMLYASDNHSILIIFQAMDGAGKDSTIEHVLSGINPQGCHVTSFKQPSTRELDHDFFWRTNIALPERGMMGIFNRSYYEEVLVTKVHPEFIINQNIPGISDLKDIDNKFWAKRYQSIRENERHLTDNGYIIIKFYLNISKEEQKMRFLDRINTPRKQWKFRFSDVTEREHWDKYMEAYETAINETSTEESPWYVIPADNKWFMQMAVCDIILNTLQKLDLKYPEPSEEELKQLERAKALLTNA